MKRKTSGSATASIVLFVTSGMLASVLGVRQYERATTEPGWVMSQAIEAGHVITGDLLKQGRVKTDEARIDNPRALLGRRLKVDKNAGDTVSAADLENRVAPVRKSLAQHVPEGRVLFSLQLGNRATIPLSQLNGGDRLDVLVRGRAGVRTVATDVRLIGVNKPRSASVPDAQDKGVMGLIPQKQKGNLSGGGVTSLVLAVNPQHVYPLANIGAKDGISLVLHSAHDVNSGNNLSVTPVSTQRAVEVMVGLNRSTVYVKR